MSTNSLDRWRQDRNAWPASLILLFVLLLFPNAVGAQEPEQDRLGPRDWLYVTVPERPGLGGPLMVDNSGQVHLEAVGGVRLRVAGRTLDDVSDDIARIFRDLLDLDNVRVDRLSEDIPRPPQDAGLPDDDARVQPPAMDELLHPGDTVLVSRDRAGRQMSLSWEVVDTSGFLLLPGFGFVRVQGRTLTEVAEVLQERRRDEPSLPELRLAYGLTELAGRAGPAISMPRLGPVEDQVTPTQDPMGWWWSLGAEGGTSDLLGAHVFFGAMGQAGRGRAGALVQLHQGSGEIYSSRLITGGLSVRLGSVGPVGIAANGLSGWYEEDRGPGVVRSTMLYGGGIRLGVQLRALEVGLAPKVLLGSYIEDGWESANPIRMLRIPVGVSIGGGAR